MYTMLMQSQLRWAGHVVRMPDNRIPKRLMFGELQEGKRSRGAPRKRYKDSLKASLKSFGIDHGTWEKTALNRCGWRTAIYKGLPRPTRPPDHLQQSSAGRPGRTAPNLVPLRKSLPSLPKNIPCEDRSDQPPTHPPAYSTPSTKKMRRWSSSSLTDEPHLVQSYQQLLIFLINSGKTLAVQAALVQESEEESIEPGIEEEITCLESKLQESLKNTELWGETLTSDEETSSDEEMDNE